MKRLRKNEPELLSKLHFILWKKILNYRGFRHCWYEFHHGVFWVEEKSDPDQSVETVQLLEAVSRCLYIADCEKASVVILNILDWQLNQGLLVYSV